MLNAVLKPVALGEDQALEHLAELAHVEQVVELGGRREHLGLHLVPQVDGYGHQLLRGCDDVCGEDIRREPAGDELAKDVVDGSDGREGHVEDAEVPLEAVRNVVLAPAGRVHRREVLNVHDHLHVSDGFIERVHAALLEELADNLVGHLVAPVVHLRHGDIIYEHDELLARRGTERTPLPLLYRALHGGLKHTGGGERREGDGFVEHLVGVEGGDERLDRGRLGRTGAAHEQRAAVDAAHQVQRELQPDRVQGWDHKRGKLRPLLQLGVLPRRHTVHPRRPFSVVLVDVILEQSVAGLHVGHIALGELAEFGVKLGTVIGGKHGAQRPADAINEEALVVPLAERLGLVALAGGLEARLKHGEQRSDGAKVPRDVLPGDASHDGLALKRDEVDDGIDVLVEHGLEQRGFLLTALVEPGRHERLPAELSLRDVDDTRSGDGRGRRVVEVFGFEHRLHHAAHLHAVAVGEGENLVVVEHGVEVLDPDGVDGSVQHDPRVVLLLLSRAAPQHGKDTLGPVARGGVEAAEHLRRGDRLGVHLPHHVLVANLSERTRECLADGCLTTAGGSHEHDTVTHQVGLVQLHALGEPRRVELEALLGGNLGHRSLDVGENSLVRLGPGEDVVDERQEEWHVLGDELGHVHVAKGSHRQVHLRFVRVCALGGAHGAQHREDVA
mmetsp:Transcript_14055/g.57079  ORF Transcript_14055/g.57079 Transcript_14055/m.57079 type:complete len:672 (+) Transcript_14055:7076-9091(+)